VFPPLKKEEIKKLFAFAFPPLKKEEIKKLFAFVPSFEKGG